MENHKAKILGVLVFLTAVFGSLAWQKVKLTQDYTSPEVSFASAPSTPEPTFEQEFLAPNGKDTLITRESRVESGSLKTFLIRTSEGEVTPILSKTLSPTTAVSVPFNVFSPDNKFIFLKEEDEWGAKYFSLPTTQGSETEPTVFSELFKQNYPNLIIEDVTGWGGMTLIVINARDEDDSRLSFWYDVTNGRFTALSNRFD